MYPASKLIGINQTGFEWIILMKDLPLSDNDPNRVH